jgi:hypothetical protein
MHAALPIQQQPFVLLTPSLLLAALYVLALLFIARALSHG